MDRTLDSLGVRNGLLLWIIFLINLFLGTQLECDDFGQNLNFKMILFHNDKLAGDEFELGEIEKETTGGNVQQKEKTLNGNGPPPPVVEEMATA